MRFLKPAGRRIFCSVDWVKASRVRFAWRFFWISQRAAGSPWSPITLASGRHLRKYGLATAEPPPTARVATSGTFQREPRWLPEKRARGGRNRQGLFLSSRVLGLV